jgi:tRNA A37 threonylcarbamoyladenosine dehydratase
MAVLSAILTELTGITVSAWGERKQRDLARLRVGIVGGGSVGSFIAEGVARTPVIYGLLPLVAPDPSI